MKSEMNIDEAKLCIQAVEAIAVAAGESGNKLNDELSAALFWGLDHLAAEAYRHLSDDNGSYLHLGSAA